MSFSEVPLPGWSGGGSGGERAVEAPSGFQPPLSSVASGINSQSYVHFAHCYASTISHLSLCTSLPRPAHLLSCFSQNDRRRPKDTRFHSLWSLFRFSVSCSPIRPLSPTPGTAAPARLPSKIPSLTAPPLFHPPSLFLCPSPHSAAGFLLHWQFQHF